jgi:hypothetical protein
MPRAPGVVSGRLRRVLLQLRAGVERGRLERRGNARLGMGLHHGGMAAQRPPRCTSPPLTLAAASRAVKTATNSNGIPARRGAGRRMKRTADCGAGVGTIASQVAWQVSDPLRTLVRSRSTDGGAGCAGRGGDDDIKLAPAKLITSSKLPPAMNLTKSGWRTKKHRQRPFPGPKARKQAKLTAWDGWQQSSRPTQRPPPDEGAKVCFPVGCLSLSTFSSRFTDLVGGPPAATGVRRHRRRRGAVVRGQTGDQTESGIKKRRPPSRS